MPLFQYTMLPAEKPVLRDYLAIDRTVLANERTLLAYLRTSLAFGVVGASAIKFFDSIWYEVVGIAFIVFALLVACAGVQRFYRVRRRVRDALAIAPVPARANATEVEKEAQAASGSSGGEPETVSS